MRRRQRLGLVLAGFEVHEARAVEALVRAKYLTEEEAQKLGALDRGLQRMTKDFVAEWVLDDEKL